MLKNNFDLSKKQTKTYPIFSQMHKQMQIPMYLGVGTNLKRKEAKKMAQKLKKNGGKTFFVYFAESWKPGTNPTQKGR